MCYFLIYFSPFSFLFRGTTNFQPHAYKREQRYELRHIFTRKPFCCLKSFKLLPQSNRASICRAFVVAETNKRANAPGLYSSIRTTSRGPETIKIPFARINHCCLVRYGPWNSVASTRNDVSTTIAESVNGDFILSILPLTRDHAAAEIPFVHCTNCLECLLIAGEKIQRIISIFALNTDTVVVSVVIESDREYWSLNVCRSTQCIWDYKIVFRCWMFFRTPTYY